MSDPNLRDFERLWRETGAVHDEVAYLTARIRAGELSTRALIRAALFGSPAARLISSHVGESASEDLDQNEMEKVLRLVFGSINMPRGIREFLSNIVQHDRRAREMLSHYELVQKDDVSPPDSAIALKALMDDLREHPAHRKAINEMLTPVFQLVPVYESEGAGFQRLIQAINTHQVQAHQVHPLAPHQENTSVSSRLRARWEMDTDASGKIIGWQVVVIEGAKNLPWEYNRFLEKYGRVQVLEDQLSQWREYCQEQGLRLCNNKWYALLQMQEIWQAPESTPLIELGMDLESMTILEDSIAQSGSFFSSGLCREGQVIFLVINPRERVQYARFRLAVVVDLP